MNNTTNTNNTVKANKAIKANKKFIASICAVVAATAMVTGIAVFSASASDIKDAPAKTPVTTVASVNDNTKKADVKETKKAETTKETSSAAVADKTDDSANAYGKHPGEAGYRYYENENENVNAYGKHPGESGYCYYENENADVNAYGKHPGECGYCYYENESANINAYGKHPGECGFNYQAVVDNYNANATPALIQAGRYIADDGSRAELVIAKPDEVTCYCTVTMGNGYNNDIVYGFLGIANGSEINYSTGSKNDMTYDNNGNVSKSVELSNGHSGKIEKTASGAFLWIDSDGTQVTFILAK